METTTEYKCPNCGAPMHFLPESQRLTCDYCASSFSIEEASAATEAQNAQEEQNFDWGNYKKNLSDEKLDGTKTFSCPSCGASVETLATTMSLVCPYCKNNMVLNEAASGGLKPNKIIPFKLTEDKLQEILRSFYKEKKLIPSAFVDAYKKAKPVGVYVPFWLFDSDLCGDAKFSAKKSHSRTSGNYRITTTEHYVIKKSGNMSFKQLPVDASLKMDNALMDSLEPFDYSKLTDFDGQYLAGYCADRFDRNPDEELPRAKERMLRKAEKLFRQSISGYSSVCLTSNSLGVKNPDVIYAMLPIYAFECKYKDQVYQYAINGQTGKIVGNFPVDTKKERFWYWFTFITSGAIAALIPLVLQIIF